jgi:hypothetical protein
VNLAMILVAVRAAILSPLSPGYLVFNAFSASLWWPVRWENLATFAALGYSVSIGLRGSVGAVTMMAVTPISQLAYFGAIKCVKAIKAHPVARRRGTPKLSMTLATCRWSSAPISMASGEVTLNPMIVLA